MNNALGYHDVPCSLFGGLSTELNPADLPEGLSPDCQDVAFLPGSVRTRPALRAIYSPSMGPAGVMYLKTFVQSNGSPLNLTLDSGGNLWAEDVPRSPGTRSLVVETEPGLFASSVTAFGREYMCFHDGLHGQDIPRQYDPALGIRRISQDGVGANPANASDTAAVVHIVQITMPPPQTILPSPLGATEVDNLVTLVTSGPHGFQVGDQVQVSNVGDGLSAYNQLSIIVEAVPTPTSLQYHVGVTGLAPSGGGTVASLVATVQTVEDDQVISGDQIIISGNSDNDFNNDFASQSAVLVSPSPSGQHPTANPTGGWVWAPSWFGPQVWRVFLLHSPDGNLVATNFGATIPNGVIIRGIQVSFKQNCVFSDHGTESSSTITEVGLWLNGAPLGAAKTPNTHFTATPSGTVETYGNGSDLWGLPQLTPQQVRSSDFGFYLTATGTDLATFDFEMTIFYGAPDHWTVVDVLDDHHFTFVAITNSGPGLGGQYIVGGLISAGIHKFVILFQTDTAYITGPSPPRQWTAGGNHRVTLRQLPLGPPNVSKRIVAFTGSGGDNYFYIPVDTTGAKSTVIPDNTSTEWTFDFSDDTLFAAAAIDIPGNNLFALEVLGACSGLFFYADRLLAWGERSHIQNFRNMGFEGGYTIATPNLPLGWTVSGTAGLLVDGGNGLGQAWQITGDGSLGSQTSAAIAQSPTGAVGLSRSRTGLVAQFTTLAAHGLAVGDTAVVQGVADPHYNGFYYVQTVVSPTVFTGFMWILPLVLPGTLPPPPPAPSGGGTAGRYGPAPLGMITQSAYQDTYKVAILAPETQYNFRCYAHCSEPAAVGVLTVELYSPSSSPQVLANVVVPIASVPPQFGFIEAPFSAKTPKVIPSDTLLRIYTSGTNLGTRVTIDECELIYADEPWNLNVRFSYVENLESFDGITGNLQPATAEPTRTISMIRDALFLRTSGSLFSTRDTGIGEPSTWDIHEISNRAGAFSTRATDVGEEWEVSATPFGLQMSYGSGPRKLSQEIQTLWDAINPQATSTIWVKNDPVQRRIFVGVPLTAYLGTPLPTPTAPNVLLVLDYRELETAAAVESSPPLHIGFSGKMLTTDLTRKWTVWNIPANSGEMIQTANAYEMVVGSGNGMNGAFSGFGNVYRFDLNKYSDDDYGRIRSYYTTYFFINHEMELNLGTGSHRKLYTYISQFIRGIGLLQITPYLDALWNPLKRLPRLKPLELAPRKDLECALNLTAERTAFRIEPVPAPALSEVAWVDAEIPLGAVNDVNVFFQLTHAPNPPQSLNLYLNGVRLRQGVDYSLAGNLITMRQAPQMGANVGDPNDQLLADYRYDPQPEMDNYFDLSKLIVTMRQDPFAPVRGRI